MSSHILAASVLLSCENLVTGEEESLSLWYNEGMRGKTQLAPSHSPKGQAQVNIGTEVFKRLPLCQRPRELKCALVL